MFMLRYITAIAGNQRPSITFVAYLRSTGRNKRFNGHHRILFEPAHIETVIKTGYFEGLFMKAAANAMAYYIPDSSEPFLSCLRFYKPSYICYTHAAADATDGLHQYIPGSIN